MIGIDQANHEAVAYAAEALFSTSDDEYASIEECATHMVTQLGVLTQTGGELARKRRADPQGDLMTNIVQARSLTSICWRTRTSTAR
ncbi:hypothetical protein [Rhodococcus artemisiae]|uniref:Uncharacterized protein n=1 Tax=Rhodococcus artemisiae TaxID=714159 RepID=A0ABU7LAI8_9NOCA|nr:hypothetical protein [Rhodococcus artemisiae]MEE2058569.1 hypothetical protein [Rhodococcus artemisiae]